MRRIGRRGPGSESGRPERTFPVTLARYLDKRHIILIHVLTCHNSRHDVLMRKIIQKCCLSGLSKRECIVAYGNVGQKKLH